MTPTLAQFQIHFSNLKPEFQNANARSTISNLHKQQRLTALNSAFGRPSGSKSVKASHKFVAVFEQDLVNMLVDWPPRSPALTPLDLFVGGHLKQLAYATKPTTISNLNEKIRDGVRQINNTTSRQAFSKKL